MLITFHFRRPSRPRLIVALLALPVLLVGAVTYMMQRPEPSFWPVLVPVAVWTIYFVAFTTISDRVTLEPDGLRSQCLGFMAWSDIQRCVIDDLAAPPSITLYSDCEKWWFGVHPMMDRPEKEAYESFLGAMEQKLAQIHEQKSGSEGAKPSVPVSTTSSATWLRWLVVGMVPLLLVGLFVVPAKVVFFLPLVVPVIAGVLLTGSGKGKNRQS